LIGERSQGKLSIILEGMSDKVDERVQDSSEEEIENEQNQKTDAADDKGKKGLQSRFYWEDKSKPFFQGVAPPNISPQKVTAEITPPSGNQTGVGSAWNSIGTWEERKLEKSELAEHLKSLPIEVKGYKVEDLTIKDGTISQVMVRGKKKLGYHLTTEFNLTKGGKSWKVNCSDFTEYGDQEVRKNPNLAYCRAKGLCRCSSRK